MYRLLAMLCATLLLSQCRHTGRLIQPTAIQLPTFKDSSGHENSHNLVVPKITTSAITAYLQSDRVPTVVQKLVSTFI